MISSSYRFNEFVKYVKDKSFPEIINLARDECYEAEVIKIFQF